MMRMGLVCCVHIIVAVEIKIKQVLECEHKGFLFFILSLFILKFE